MQVNAPAPPPPIATAFTPAQRTAPPSAPTESERPVEPAEEDTRPGDSDVEIKKDARRDRPGQRVDIRV